MSDSTITYLTDAVMITVVVQRGMEEAILQAARDVGATTGAVGYYANGIGMRERLGMLGLAVEVEKAVISMIVPTDHQDVVIDQIYRAGKMDTPGIGYVYSTPLEKMAAFVPQSVRERMEKPEASVD